MTNESWAQSSVVAPPTPSASVCIRFKVFFFRPLTHVFSLTSREETREINGEVFVDYVRPIVSSAFYFLGISEPLQVLTWYHYCLTYDHTNATIAAYLDGNLQGTISRNTTRRFAEATLVLGQYSIEYLKGYTQARSFSGHLTHAGVWNRPLSPQEVAELAACGSVRRGLVIPWDQEWVLSNASFIEVATEDICEKKTKASYLKLSAMPYAAALHACSGLGGRLPVPRDLAHALELIQQLREPEAIAQTWVGATDEGVEGTYVDFYSGKPMTWFRWGSNDPNGLQWQNCLILDEDFLHDYPCHVSRETLCFLPTQLEWTLRGPCEEDTANYKFSLLHPAKGQVVFRGYYQYEIAEEGDAWVWRNALTDEVLGRLPHEAERWPMGRKNWTIEGEVCERSGVQQVLQLSSCTPGQFTCRDGSCIPRPLRCDRRPDCHDESDERECRLVQPPLGYHHSLPPPGSAPGVPLPVGLSMKIVSLSLSDKDSYLETTYHLNMTWSDLRLRFHNLKGASRLNQVPTTEHDTLWSPTLTMVNVRGTERTMVDSEAVLTIHREGEPLEDDFTVPEDINVYLGSENHLSVERKYTSQFLCDLDLALYPFDVQRCFMALEVLSAATDFVVLEEAISTVSYVGAKLLIEYEVVDVRLAVSNNQTMAEAEVEVELQRRVGYPIISIYVPTVILLILAYLSLVFRRDNFETRVMSALTVLLVLASLFTQTSTSLPKTSYFKMVDVWLLFSISLIFFVIVFHVLIDMAADGKLLSAASGIGSSIRVAPAEGKEARDVPLKALPKPTRGLSRWVLGGDIESHLERNRKLCDKLYKYAMIFIPCYFLFFNVVYWLYIFA
ncbi:uncharacterized protein [Penaeus vannamei]|uniref:uncharacterized protein n=1 Tax=Penaeus vannamei TaxID=6689 RepID=UPI00387F64CE